MMASLRDFLVMGGYASFVWPAYGLGVLVLGLNGVLALRRERYLLREMAKRNLPGYRVA